MPDLYDNQDSLEQLEDGSNLTDQISSVGSSFVTGKQREKAAQLAKQWIHQFIDAAIEGGIKGVISTFAAPVAIFAILVTAVPLCLVSVKYLLNMSADPVTDAVRDAVHEAYDDVKKDSVIMNNLNMSYGCEFTAQDAHYNADGSIDFVTEGCEIHVGFEPDIELIARIVSAYTTATNGTIAQFTESPTFFDENIIIDESNGEVVGYNSENLPDIYNAENYVVFDGYDANGLPKYKVAEPAQEQIDEFFDSEYTNAASGDFADVIHSYAGSFFEIETGMDAWENNTIHRHTFTYYDDVCYKIKQDGAYTGSASSTQDEDVHIRMSSTRPCEVDTSHYRMEKEERKVEGYLGSVSIPIYFDLTGYKAAELEEIIDRLSSANKRCVFEWVDGQLIGEDTCTNDEASTLVNETLYDYYLSSYSYINYEGNELQNSNLISSDWKGTSDFFNVDEEILIKYFKGNFAGGSEYDLSQIPGGELLIGEIAGFTPDFSNKAAWRHPTEGGTNRFAYGQCTWFAYGVFYQLYGKAPNGCAGNGASWVNQFSMPGWSKSRSPTPGSMCSAVSLAGHRYGTVAIVLKVVNDDTMYILHGNSNANLVEDPWSVAIKDWSVQKVSTKSYTYRDGNSAAWVFANPPR